MSRFPGARFLVSAASPRQFPPDRGAEVAFAGRSNAGKSSAINALVQRRSLARTSKTPGRTRQLNFFELAPDRRIVDLPGYGYAEVPESERREWANLVEALRQRQSLCGLFLVVDARRGLMAGDEALIAWADPDTRGVHVLLSKADKLSRSEAARALRTASEALAGRATVQLFSAPDRTGVEEARRVLESWLANGPRPNKKTPVTSGEATGAD